MIYNSEWILREALALNYNQKFFVYFILLSLLVCNINISSASQLKSGWVKNKLVLKNETKIVGGPEAEPHEFPHMLALYLYNRDDRKFVFQCGASIINSNFALTAAHCVEAERPENVKVVGGEHDRFKNEGTEIVIDISQIIPHEDYNGVYIDDIAILRFSKPITFNDNIAPIQMATRNRNTSGNNNSGNAVISGWGSTSFPGKTSKILRKGQVLLVSTEECRKLRPTEDVDDRQICAGNMGGKPDACRGDYGGPLMQMARRGNNHILVGISSYGTPCARPNQPTVYTKVAKYRDWIDSKIAA